MSAEPTSKQNDAHPLSGKPSGQPIFIGALVAVLLILSLASFWAAGTSTACSLCHSSAALAMSKTPHHDVACAACHLSASGPFAGRVAVITRMVPASLGGLNPRDAGRVVPDGACLTCHSKSPSAGVIRAGSLTINHTACITSAHCEDCHTTSIHGTATRVVRQPQMASCVTCHSAKRVATKCDSCHPERVVANATDSDWRLIHGRDWKKLHGTGDLRTCSACHVEGYCKRCHKASFPHPSDFGTTHGVSVQTVGTPACLTCHQKQSFCDGCHGMQMPHPADFLQRHSSIARSADDPRCQTCHPVEDCLQCHLYHIHPGGPKETAQGGGGGQ